MSNFMQLTLDPHWQKSLALDARGTKLMVHSLLGGVGGRSRKAKIKNRNCLDTTEQATADCWALLSKIWTVSWSHITFSGTHDFPKGATEFKWWKWQPCQSLSLTVTWTDMFYTLLSPNELYRELLISSIILPTVTTFMVILIFNCWRNCWWWNFVINTFSSRRLSNTGSGWRAPKKHRICL